jgi:hypothetical protein
MGFQGAACFHTLIEEKRDVPKDQWDDERFGQICEKADVFADWKSVIEKLCSLSGDCDYQTKKNLKKFFERVELFEQLSIREKK